MGWGSGSCSYCASSFTSVCPPIFSSSFCVSYRTVLASYRFGFGSCRIDFPFHVEDLVVLLSYVIGVLEGDSFTLVDGESSMLMGVFDKG